MSDTCGARDGAWICVSPRAHPEGRHYFVKAERACKQCSAGGFVCTERHTDGRGPRVHCRASFTHDQLLPAPAGTPVVSA